MGPDGVVRSGWKVAGFFGLCVASVMGAAVLVGMFGPAWALRDGQPWPVVAVSALLIVGVTGLCLRFEGRSWADAGLLPDRVRLGQLAAGMAGGLVLVGGLAWMLMLGGVLHWEPNRPFTTSLMVSGTLYFVCAVLVEELVFRGYALRRLAEGIGATAAVVVLAVIFGGYHLLSVGSSVTVKDGGAELAWTAVGPLVGAIVFGFAAVRTGGIALPLGLHLGWNWTQWHFFTFPADDNPVGLWTPLVSAHLAGDPAPFRVGYLVTMGLAVAAIAVMTRRPQHPFTALAPRLP
ncbi:CPBP family intramembrane glutamic endopeptidase [Actinoplanes italicus]|uniref:CPBP family intramembrane glutamic endopeptidase n=1 Tax=Actinoplanes italicus TaxID=113567 RepID=UPI0011B2459D|nr:type II CAAX endopeptidase family protein [Actinoplanes italicus]